MLICHNKIYVKLRVLYANEKVVNYDIKKKKLAVTLYYQLKMKSLDKDTTQCCRN